MLHMILHRVVVVVVCVLRKAKKNLLPKVGRRLAAITDQPIERLAVAARRCAYAGVNTADAGVSTGAAARSLPFGGWISPFA